MQPSCRWCHRIAQPGNPYCRTTTVSHDGHVPHSRCLLSILLGLAGAAGRNMGGEPLQHHDMVNGRWLMQRRMQMALHAAALISSMPNRYLPHLIGTIRDRSLCTMVKAILATRATTTTPDTPACGTGIHAVCAMCRPLHKGYMCLACSSACRITPASSAPVPAGPACAVVRMRPLLAPIPAGTPHLAFHPFLLIEYNIQGFFCRWPLFQRLPTKLPDSPHSGCLLQAQLSPSARHTRTCRNQQATGEARHLLRHPWRRSCYGSPGSCGSDHSQGLTPLPCLSVYLKQYVERRARRRRGRRASTRSRHM